MSKTARTVATLALWLAALVPAASSAQFVQYLEPGSFNLGREATQEDFETAMEEARWRLGRLYVDPWVGLRDLGWVDNVQGLSESRPTAADFTVTLGAGVRAYRPIGGEVIFAAHLLPEYVWWQDSTERRRLNGRYGAGFFGNLGRTGFEVTARRVDESRYFSREVEARVNSRDDRLDASVEVELGAGVSLFASGRLRQIESLTTDEEGLEGIDVLDRDETLVRAGVRFRLAGDWVVGIGAEESETDFAAQIVDRSSSGTSPVVELGLESDVVRLEADVAFRDLEPTAGSLFEPYREATGRLRLGIKPTGRAELQLFADRNLVYSVDPRYTYFEDTAWGVGLLTSLGSSVSLRVFAQTGTDDFAAVAAAPPRSDDFDSFGGSVRVGFGRVTLEVSGARTRYESSVADFDRQITEIRTGLSIGRRSGSSWY